MGSHIAKPSNKEMVDELVEDHSYIHSPIVEGVFRAVDRAMYFDLEEGEAVNPYEDGPWRRGNLHLSAPCIYAKVVEALELKPVGPHGINHGIEYYSDVVEYANKRLQQFKQKSYAIDKYDFVEPIFVRGNCLNLNPNSKYDRIYLGAACLPDLEMFMKRLVKQNGGILVMPYENHLMRYIRISEQEWKTEKLMDVSFTLMLRRNAHNGHPDGEEDNEGTIIDMPLAQAKSLKELCRIAIRQQLRDKTDSLNPHLLHSDNIRSRRLRKAKAERELRRKQRRKSEEIQALGNRHRQHGLMISPPVGYRHRRRRQVNSLPPTSSAYRPSLPKPNGDCVCRRCEIISDQSNEESSAPSAATNNVAETSSGNGMVTRSASRRLGANRRSETATGRSFPLDHHPGASSSSSSSEGEEEASEADYSNGLNSSDSENNQSKKGPNDSRSGQRSLPAGVRTEPSNSSIDSLVMSDCARTRPFVCPSRHLTPPFSARPRRTVASAEQNHFQHRISESSSSSSSELSDMVDEFDYIGAHVVLNFPAFFRIHDGNEFNNNLDNNLGIDIADDDDDDEFDRHYLQQGDSSESDDSNMSHLWNGGGGLNYDCNGDAIDEDEDAMDRGIEDLVSSDSSCYDCDRFAIDGDDADYYSESESCSSEASCGCSSSCSFDGQVKVKGDNYDNNDRDLLDENVEDYTEQLVCTRSSLKQTTSTSTCNMDMPSEPCLILPSTSTSIAPLTDGSHLDSGQFERGSFYNEPVARRLRSKNAPTADMVATCEELATKPSCSGKYSEKSRGIGDGSQPSDKNLAESRAHSSHIQARHCRHHNRRTHRIDCPNYRNHRAAAPANHRNRSSLDPPSIAPVHQASGSSSRANVTIHEDQQSSNEQRNVFKGCLLITTGRATLSLATRHQTPNSSMVAPRAQSTRETLTGPVGENDSEHLTTASSNAANTPHPAQNQPVHPQVRQPPSRINRHRHQHHCLRCRLHDLRSIQPAKDRKRKRRSSSESSEVNESSGATGGNSSPPSHNAASRFCRSNPLHQQQCSGQVATNCGRCLHRLKSLSATRLHHKCATNPRQVDAAGGPTTSEAGTSYQHSRPISARPSNSIAESNLASKRTEQQQQQLQADRSHLSSQHQQTGWPIATRRSTRTVAATGASTSTNKRAPSSGEGGSVLAPNRHTTCVCQASTASPVVGHRCDHQRRACRHSRQHRHRYHHGRPARCGHRQCLAMASLARPTEAMATSRLNSAAARKRLRCRRAERKRRCLRKKRCRAENECERYHNHLSGYISELPLPRVLHNYLNYDRNL